MTRRFYGLAIIPAWRGLSRSVAAIMAANGTLRSVRFVTKNFDKRSFTSCFYTFDANRTAESLIATARTMADGIFADSRLGRR